MEIIDTSGFYRMEEGELIYARNSLYGNGYELHRDNHLTYTYPIDGWTWFDSAPEAKSILKYAEVWKPDIPVELGETYRYEGVTYEVITAHMTQASWAPNLVPALFKVWVDPDAVSAWVQPTGAQDAYPLGARVTHNGFTWESLVEANVWEPGAVGSESLWTQI